MIILGNKISELENILSAKYYAEINNFIQNQNNNIPSSTKFNLNYNITAIYLEFDGSINEFNHLLEAHKKFIDLHYVILNSDNIVFKSTTQCNIIEKEYDPENDYLLFNEVFANKVTLHQENFALIFPETAHMTNHEIGDILKKWVFKIPVNNLQVEKIQST